MKKIAKNIKGFTLTEVMIAMMVLTVAIVSASNLLVGLINSNKTITNTMQAYYLAQEGLELVRNTRDTNWLHNQNWLGDDGLFGKFEKEYAYSIDLDERGWRNSTAANIQNISELAAYKPWNFQKESSIENVEAQSSVFSVADFDGFYRHVEFLPYEECGEESCADFVKVRSVVSWGENKEVILEEILSNWKGGVL